MHKRIFIILAVLLIFGIICGCSEMDDFKEDVKKEFDEAIENEGGWEGVGNNAEEMIRNTTDALGITEREEYVIDEDGTLVLDENGNPIKRRVSDGAIITEEPSKKEEQGTSSSGYNVYSLGDVVEFNTENGGVISIVLTDYGACWDNLSEKNILYIDYTIENTGNTSVKVGEGIFNIFADDCSVDQKFGENSKGNAELSNGRKLQGTIYGDIDPYTVFNIEVECTNAIFVIKDVASLESMLGFYFWQTGENEDARGAEITIGYDTNNNLAMAGKCWNSIDSEEISAVATMINDDGSIVFTVGEGTIYIYPTTTGDIYVEQYGYIGEMMTMSFEGTYQKMAN